MILAVAHTIRAGSAAAIARIQALNVPVIMLAGDNPGTGAPRHCIRGCAGAGPSMPARLPTQRQRNQQRDAPASDRPIWRIAGPAWDAALYGV
jgi:hypothetical protein